MIRTTGASSRFIPAHAGKTPGTAKAVSLDKVHPRACGENLNDKVTGRFSIGSSPRMRGKRIQPDGLPGPLRFIPAHAGKTCRV